MDRVQVRGLLVLRQRSLMEGMAGAAVVKEAIEAVDPLLRAAYEGASLLSWVPQRAVREVTRQVALRMKIAPAALAERVVRASVSELCAGPWNILLRMTSDEALIGRAGTLFSRSFDAGSVDTRLVDDGLIELTLRGWPYADEMDLASVSAGIEATLTSVGRKGEIQRRGTPDGAIYTIRVH